MTGEQPAHAPRPPARPVTRQELRERGAFATSVGTNRPAPPAVASTATASVVSAPMTATVSDSVAAPSSSPAPPPRPVAVPAFAPAPLQVGLTHRVLGAEPGQPRLPDATAGSRVGLLAPLERAGELLPELEGETTPRPFWRQPAFLVATGAAVVMLLAVGAVLIVQGVLRSPDRVENLAITDVGSQYYLSWDGPNIPYSVIITGTGSPADISAYVKGRSVWLPRSASHVNGDSCFVVRSLAAARENPSTNTEVVAAQGGRTVCVSDAKAED